MDILCKRSIASAREHTWGQVSFGLHRPPAVPFVVGLTDKPRLRRKMERRAVVALFRGAGFEQGSPEDLLAFSYQVLWEDNGRRQRSEHVFPSLPDLTPTSAKRWTYWESNRDTPLPESPAGQTILHNCSSSPFSCPFCLAFSSVSYTAEAIAPDRKSRAPQ